jgi:large conductance mechanosensitive channel
MLKEFQTFAMKGSVIDLAVGIVIGGAFNRIVTSFVNDVLMPPFGLVLARVNFNNLYIDLSGGKYKSLADAQAAGDATINYGIFINNVIDFLIVAVVLFLVIRQINRFRSKIQGPPGTPTTKSCPYCYSVIPIKATRCPECTSELSLTPGEANA